MKIMTLDGQYVYFISVSQYLASIRQPSRLFGLTI